MYIRKENRKVICEHLFKEGVLWAKKNMFLPRHPEIPVPNLEVIKLMQSFKSKKYVEESFNWQIYYWKLTEDGKKFLQEYLNFPNNVVPNTWKEDPDKITPHYERGEFGRGGRFRRDDRGGGFRGGDGFGDEEVTRIAAEEDIVVLMMNPVAGKILAVEEANPQKTEADEVDMEEAVEDLEEAEDLEETAMKDLEENAVNLEETAAKDLEEAAVKDLETVVKDLEEAVVKDLETAVKDLEEAAVKDLAEVVVTLAEAVVTLAEEAEAVDLVGDVVNLEAVATLAGDEVVDLVEESADLMVMKTVEDLAVAAEEVATKGEEWISNFQIVFLRIFFDLISSVLSVFFI